MTFLAKKGISRKELKPGRWVRDKDGLLWVMCPHHHGGGVGYAVLIHGWRDTKKNWKIGALGIVTPSLWIKMEDCNWHVFLTLEGWTPQP